MEKVVSIGYVTQGSAIVQLNTVYTLIKVATITVYLLTKITFRELIPVFVTVILSSVADC